MLPLVASKYGLGQLASDQGRSYLQAPSPHTLEQMDEALRKQFERCGMIGPTVLGFCSAGTCVRPSNRGICANCRYLVPHYSNLLKAKTWRRLYVLQAKLHDDQGHAVDADQARKMVQYIDDAIRIMEIQWSCACCERFLSAVRSLIS